jgi:hypothetical protein
MICPCCGQEREIAAVECHCGARQVGTPLAPPDRMLPKLGPAIAALACALLIIFVFLAAWIFSNDSKVGRSIMVTLLGEGTLLTRSLLQADPKLPYYRIFAYDAYRQAFYLSVGLIPLSLIGIWLARRAQRLTSAQPARFGGRRMARTSLLMSSTSLIALTAVVAIYMPEAIERGRAKRRAATRVAMYQLHQQALLRFHQEYGSYPQDLTDLSRVNAENAPKADYWERPFSYRPVVEIASKGSAASFTNYRLVSAGADGKYGTSDDLTMIDGVILEGPVDDDLPISGIINRK